MYVVVRKVRSAPRREGDCVLDLLIGPPCLGLDGWSLSADPSREHALPDFVTSNRLKSDPISRMLVERIS